MSITMRKVSLSHLQVRSWLKERGLLWTVLYVLRWGVALVLRGIDHLIMTIERRHLWMGKDTVSALYHTVEENRATWNEWDWSQRGEEWTSDLNPSRGSDPQAWKQTLIDDMMRRYITPGSTVLEIGPGGGRWTEFLQPIAGRLLLADVAEKCLEVCQERFAGCSNLEYHLVTDRLEFIPDDSIDHVWSYDVFVHLNAETIQQYLEDFRRILKPGGVAVIHHGGNYTFRKRILGWRSQVDDRFFTHLVEQQGLEIIQQDRQHGHIEGDVITVFRKPSAGS